MESYRAFLHMRTFFDRKKFPHFVNFSHLRGKSISFYLSFLYEAIIIKLMCYVYYSGAILYYIPLLVPSGRSRITSVPGLFLPPGSQCTRD